MSSSGGTDENPPPYQRAGDNGEEPFVPQLQYFTLAFFILGIVGLFITTSLYCVRMMRKRQTEASSYWPHDTTQPDIERGNNNTLQSTSNNNAVSITPVKQVVVVVQPDGGHHVGFSSEILLKDAAVQVQESQLRPLPSVHRRTRSALATVARPQSLPMLVAEEQPPQASTADNDVDTTAAAQPSSSLIGEEQVRAGELEEGNNEQQTRTASHSTSRSRSKRHRTRHSSSHHASTRKSTRRRQDAGCQTEE